MMDSRLTALHAYDRAGWCMTPTRGKRPYRTGWQTERLGAEVMAEIVAASRGDIGIGVLLGEPSGWLTDIDLDHPLAVELADDYLPATGAIFGRRGKPRSHRLYVVSEPVVTQQHHLTDADKSMIVELRSTGCQTVFPPSTHPSGERILWHSTDEPVVVGPAELSAAVTQLADAVRVKLGIPTPPPKTNGHAPHQHRDHAPLDRATIIGNARKYLAEIPPAISGQRGGPATFLAAQHLVRGFELNDADAMTLLHEWNQRCEPPWSDAELSHKITSARETGTAVAIGQHLRDTRPPPTGSSAAPRNGSGTPLRTPLAAGTKVRCSDRGNLGDVIHDVGGPMITVEHVGRDGTKTVDHPAAEVSLADGSPVVPTTIEPPPMLSVRELVATHRKLREPIIDGLLREGETMNIIAATKIGKSWLATLLALDFATQRKWLGRFETAGGDVLIVDNELHAETSAYRIPAVATANMTHLDDYADHVFVMNLRGGLVSLPELAAILSTIDPGKFKLIILDAFYRFLPPGTDENDNGAMAALYNLLDQLAGKVQCAIVCIHHSSKGSQAGKSVTDVGSGAGSMSRAADCHVVLRPHEKENVVVMEAAARSWPPLAPLCLRWEWPLFSEDTTLDPTLLRPERPKTTERERSARLAADVERLLELLKQTSEPLTRNEISVRLGLNDKNFKAAFAEILTRNLLVQSGKKAGNGQSYDAYLLHSDTPTSE